MAINFKQKVGGLLWLIFCSAPSFPSMAAADVVITMKNPQPTCSVSVQPEYDLGGLPLGQKKHNRFPVSVNCSGVIRTSLVAKNLDGVLQNDQSQVSIAMTHNGVSRGPFLWLLNDRNEKVKLTGRQSDAFCTANSQYSVCYLTPVTNMLTNSGWGDGSVSIRFDVVYLA